MVAAPVIGHSAGKSLWTSSYYYSVLTEKLYNDHGLAFYQIFSMKKVIVAKGSSNYGSSVSLSSRNTQSVKALKEHVENVSIVDTRLQTLDHLDEQSLDLDETIEELLLLQKSMLEKQWNLSYEWMELSDTAVTKSYEKIPVTCSGVSARQRRIDSKRKTLNQCKSSMQSNKFKLLTSVDSSELLHKSTKSYLKGVLSEDLLSHAEVVRLSTVIKAGLSLEEHKTRLKGGLGCDPSDEQLANSLRISRTELQSQLMACSLAREKLVMSNIRLVMSIAQKYDHVGANMPDLVQGGLIGLLRGIEKFDSSKGFKISTYVYWWIRQGITRAFAENSRTLRLPNYLHERLGLIRTAKIRLQEKGITPSIDRIADLVNMSPKQVRNATEAVSKIYSLDREPFPSLNGLPGDTYHSYIADKHPENGPWCAIDQWSLKEEVNNLINLTLREREREIVRLYYGLDNEYLTWDDISKRIGLSRERVRQVGLVALEKLKHAARKTKMKALLLKH